MKVRDTRQYETITFKDLDMGGIFEYDDMVYMKIEPVKCAVYGTLYNAVCLNDGTMEGFPDYECISEIDAEIIIK